MVSANVSVRLSKESRLPSDTETDVVLALLVTLLSSLVILSVLTRSTLLVPQWLSWSGLSFLNWDSSAGKIVELHSCF